MSRCTLWPSCCDIFTRPVLAAGIVEGWSDAVESRELLGDGQFENLRLSNAKATWLKGSSFWLSDLRISGQLVVLEGAV